MRALITAVIAAIEAAAVALAVFAIIAVPSVLFWWLMFDLGAEPSEVAGTAASLWQLAHFVPMRIEISAQSALGLGLTPEAFSFVLSLAPLGLTLLTASLAFRSGWRFAASGAVGAWALLGGTAGFAVAASVAATFAGDSDDWQLWARIAVPTAAYAAPLALAYVVRSAVAGEEWWLQFVRQLQLLLARAMPGAAAALPERAAETLRFALAALVGLLALGTAGTALAIIVGYVDIVTLSQGLQLDALGAISLFVLHLILLPVAWVWSVSWFAGSGFSLGTATLASPFETYLGPLPVLPLFGAIPESWGWAGAVAPAIVVAVGATVGGVLAGRPVMRRASALVSLLIPLSAAVLVGAIVALTGTLASGSIGPGRLTDTGPTGWVFGALVAVELAFGMSLGVFARRVDVASLREFVPTVGDREKVPAVSGDTAPDEATLGQAATADAASVLRQSEGALSARDMRARESYGGFFNEPTDAEPASFSTASEQPTVEVEPLSASSEQPTAEVDYLSEPGEQPTVELEPLAMTDEQHASTRGRGSVPEREPKTESEQEAATAPAPEAAPEPDIAEPAAPEPAAPEPPDPEPEDTVDPLVRAFSWDAKPEASPQPVSEKASWRDRLRPKRQRDF